MLCSFHLLFPVEQFVDTTLPFVSDVPTLFPSQHLLPAQNNKVMSLSIGALIGETLTVCVEKY